MTQVYTHPYTPEQCAALDTAFDQWADADLVAAYHGYDNADANARAEELAAQHDALLQYIRQWAALPEDAQAAYDAVWNVSAEEVM